MMAIVRLCEYFDLMGHGEFESDVQSTFVLINALRLISLYFSCEILETTILFNYYY